MENSVALAGQNGIPFEEVVCAIRKRFTVGQTLELDSQKVVKKTLHSKFVEGFRLAKKKKPSDIPLLIYPCYYPEVPAYIDENGYKTKIIYIKANLYLRYRFALSWGQDTDKFVSYEYANLYQKLLEERADAILDLDKVMANNDPLTLPDLTDILDRQFSKLLIYSSKVRSR